jgi:hypothetical protein
VLGLQKGGEEDRTIILTSDQKVLLISLRKEKVLNSLQTLMKTVAVDCQLNFSDNNDGTFRCMSLGDSIGDFAYHPDLQKDIQETEARFKVAPAAPVEVAQAAPVKLKRLRFKKTNYYYTTKMSPDGNVLGYLLYSMEDPELKNPVGYVLPDPETLLPTGDILPVP